jgi:carboxymethylenebutenolidase
MNKTIRLFGWICCLALVAGTLVAQDDYVERMEREHEGDKPVASPASQVEPAVEVLGKEVHYGVLGDKTIYGYLARPEDSEGGPALLVIHEWWGLNENVRAMADRFAGEGYTALAVDLYEGEVAADRDTAGALARASAGKTERLLDNLRQAHLYLKDHLGASSVGVIGWCFGGGWSLRTALALGDEIDAAVIYYSRLITDPGLLEPLASPVLGIFGALDEGIPVTSVREFQLALDGLGKESSIHIYEDADHAFANPSGTRYNAKAAEDAWQKTLVFLASNLE